jgi:N-methylhydantoinase A
MGRKFFVRHAKYCRVDIGVDVGGTFTDFVGFRGRDVVTAKLLSTPRPASAILRGFRDLHADGMVHGTTVATNAILERRGASTALITTAGFEDLLAIGRQDRPKLYDLHVPKPTPPVPRDRCFGVRERVDAHGRVLTDLTDAEVRRVARAVKRSGAESVAVSLLFSFLHPEHEKRLGAAFPGIAVSLSHEVLAEFRSYERTSTTVLDAYIKPLVARYLQDLRDRVRREFLIMKSTGGVASAELVQERPIEMVLSGPAGGLSAAAALARRMRAPHVVTFDMGGTSADFSVVTDGEPSWTNEAVIDRFPMAIPVIAIESVGAGGGSLAWIDAGGALRVGPASAGASPGPIAYGKGGHNPTVTDADLVGGMLGTHILGGRLALRPRLARTGLAKLSKRLDVALDETVLGIQRVVEASMAKSMRLILSKRGADPAEFRLLAFGGAGAMHACALAREIGIPRVIVPFLPGVFSAYGILVSDIRVAYGQSVSRPLSRARARIRGILDGFRERAERDLTAQGLDPRRALFTASLDLRYRGQSYDLNVPIRGNVARRFRDLHRARYGYAPPAGPIELVTVRLAARLPRTAHVPAPIRRATPRHSTRRVLFEGGWFETPVLDRESLPVGFHLEGPLIVEEAYATTVVPPEATLEVDPLGLLDIEVGP